MANVKNFGLIGVGSNVQFGKAGSKIVLDEGTFKFRNAAADADAALTAAGITSSGNLALTATSGTITVGTDTTLSRQAAGVFKFDGSAAFVAPTGNDAARPTGVVGAVRVSTQAGATAGAVEFYNGTAWKTLADTGITSGIQTELDAVETSLGDAINSDGTFNGAAFTDSASGATSFTDAINQVAGAIAAANTLEEIEPVQAQGNIIYADSGSTWAQALPGETSGVQAWDAGLASIAGLSTSADQMIYTTGSDTYATTSLTSFARGLLDDASASDARSTLGLVIGTDVQAYDAGLAALASKTSTGLMVQTGNDTYTSVTISGTSGNIVVTNGDGVSGGPAINLAEVTQASSGDFVKVTLDGFGRVTGNTAVTSSDITTALGYTPVNKAGDTMTGALTLSGAPTTDLQAATKKYVDDAVAGASSDVSDIETALGSAYNTSTNSFDATALTGDAFTSPTSFTSAIQQVANYATGHDELSELLDVTLTGPASGEVLQYNGSAWVNHELVLADISDVTTSAAELNELDGSGATQADFIKLHALTATATELNYVDGVTSSIQTQLDNKQALDATLTALAGLDSSAGMVVQTGADTFTKRELVAPASGITITNPAGTAGNPTFALSDDLAGVEGLATTGIAVRTGDGTWTTRDITGNVGRIVVTNGDGVTSEPNIDLATVTQGSSGDFVKITLDSYGRVSGNTAVTTADITALVDNTYVNVAGDTMEGNLDFAGTYKVTGLAAPTAGSDAATKNYVDNAVTGLSWKQAVHLIAVAVNVPLTGSTPLVIDGDTVTDQQRVLLTGQTDGYANGIYVATITGGTYALARSSDADTFQELNGAAVFVQAGTVYADSGWVQTATLTSLTTGAEQDWVQFSGAGAYAAGNGIAITGNEISAVIGDGLTDVSGATTVKVTSGNAVQLVGTSPNKAVELVLDTGSGLAQSSSGLKINAASVTNAMLANSTFALTADTGNDSLALGEGLHITGASAQGISVALVETTGPISQFTITAADASSSQKGVATFNTASFTVTSGDVTIKSAGVSNSQLANSSITFTGTTGSDAVALGESMAIVGAVDGIVSTAMGTNSLEITVRDATASLKGVASFDGTDFSVTSGAVSIANVNLGTQTTGDYAASLAVTSGTGLSLTGSAGEGTAYTIAGVDATTSSKGVASFSSTNFSVTSGAVSIKAGGVNLTTDVTGTLPVANGGTGATTFTAGQVLLGNGTSAIATDADLAFDAGTNTLTVGSATIAGAAAGDVTITATGTNGDINLVPNGTGQVIVGSSGSGTIASDTGETLTVTGTAGLTLASGSGDVVLSLAGTTANKVSVSGPSATDYANGLAANDLVNKQYVDDAIASGASAGAVKAYQAVVSLNGSTPVTLGTMPAGATVLRVKVNVTSAAGAGTLVVGKSGTTNAYMTSDENDTTATGLYVAETFVTESGSVAIVATPSGGSAGSATVIVEYQVAQ